MDIVLLLGLVVIIGLAMLTFDSPSTHQEVYVIRTQPQPAGCGPIGFFFLGMFVCLVIVVVFVIG